MKKENYKTSGNKFEFILKINDHIIISRYFSADNYNPQVRNSVDIRNCVEDIVDHIQETLKLRDIEYQWGQALLVNMFTILVPSPI
ncbi:MAG: hypothetical protein AABY22_02800 [Nanoarchaeota archaeon]